jgi:predicted alpha/beta hydrolase
MATVASQSGYWKAQGGRSRWATGLHMGVSIPVLSRMSGYMPWSSLRGGEDLPKGVALQWAKWANDPRYLLGDTTIPRERIKYFSAPVLAHTFTDEPPADPTAVDPVVDAYPNVTRLVIDPKDIGIEGTGHVGFFSLQAGPLWDDLVGWFDMHAGADQDA